MLLQNETKGMNKLKSSTVLKWISGGLEAFWGFPIIGGTFVIGLAYTPLMLMFILHIITLIFYLSRIKKCMEVYLESLHP